jgi:uncharacterized membrane protein
MAVKELVICKSCGFVMDKAKVKDKCPACGVPAKIFQPYTDTISAHRRFLLSLDLHPVLVHFPQAFSATMLLLALATFVLGGEIRDKLIATMTVIGVVLPVTVLLAFIAGLIDGKTRFRRVTTPILTRKIVFGGLFFIVSCLITAIILSIPPCDTRSVVYIAALSAVCLGCATMLGLWGVSVLESKFRG